MNVASRTPEGEPYLCPVCGAFAPLETSDAGDSLCPQCGQLLWKLRDSLEAITLSPIQSIALSDSITEHLADSLEIIELVMQFEDQFGTSIPDDADERFRTIADVLRWLREQQQGD
ncbi:MAG: acyl carrier protein [Planctomycetaceae bacterium]